MDVDHTPIVDDENDEEFQAAIRLSLQESFSPPATQESTPRAPGAAAFLERRSRMTGLGSSQPNKKLPSDGAPNGGLNSSISSKPPFADEDVPRATSNIPILPQNPLHLIGINAGNTEEHARKAPKLKETEETSGFGAPTELSPSSLPPHNTFKDLPSDPPRKLRGSTQDPGKRATATIDLDDEEPIPSVPARKPASKPSSASLSEHPRSNLVPSRPQLAKAPEVVHIAVEDDNDEGAALKIRPNLGEMHDALEISPSQEKELEEEEREVMKSIMGESRVGTSKADGQSGVSSKSVPATKPGAGTAGTGAAVVAAATEDQELSEPQWQLAMEKLTEEQLNGFLEGFLSKSTVLQLISLPPSPTKRSRRPNSTVISPNSSPPKMPNMATERKSSSPSSSSNGALTTTPSAPSTSTFKPNPNVDHHNHRGPVTAIPLPQHSIVISPFAAPQRQTWMNYVTTMGGPMKTRMKSSATTPMPEFLRITDLITMDVQRITLTTFKLDLIWLVGTVRPALQRQTVIFHGEEDDPYGGTQLPGYGITSPASGASLTLEQSRERFWRYFKEGYMAKFSSSSSSSSGKPMPLFPSSCPIKAIKSIVSNTRGSYNFPGTPHGKVMLLEYSQFLRVVVTTANLVESDYLQRTQGFWFQDFPLLTLVPQECDHFHTMDAETQETVKMLAKDFLKTLIDYMVRLAPRGTFDPSMLEKYDYRNVRVSLITMISGRVPLEQGQKYGHLKVSNLLSQEPPPPTVPFHAPFNIFAQSSSLGTLSKKYMDDVAQSFCSKKVSADSSTLLTHLRLPTTTTTTTTTTASSATAASAKKAVISAPHLSGPQMTPGQRLRIVWPSRDFVRNSILGYQAGGSIFASAKHILDKKFVQACLIPYEPIQPERRRVSPHIKSYWKQYFDDDKTLGWTCLTSSNFSKAAWGEQQTNNAFDMPNFECGVLFLPSILAIPSTFGADPVLEEERGAFELGVGGGGGAAAAARGVGSVPGSGTSFGGPSRPSSSAIMIVDIDDEDDVVMTGVTAGGQKQQQQHHPQTRNLLHNQPPPPHHPLNQGYLHLSGFSPLSSASAASLSSQSSPFLPSATSERPSRISISLHSGPNSCLSFAPPVASSSSSKRQHVKITYPIPFDTSTPLYPPESFQKHSPTQPWLRDVPSTQLDTYGQPYLVDS